MSDIPTTAERALERVHKARGVLREAQLEYDAALAAAVHAGLHDRVIAAAVGLKPDAIRMWRGRQARRRRHR